VDIESLALFSADQFESEVHARGMAWGRRCSNAAMNAARLEQKHMGMALKPVFVVQAYAAMIGDSPTHEEAAEVGHGPLAQPGEEYLTANWLLAVLGHVSWVPAYHMNCTIAECRVDSCRRGIAARVSNLDDVVTWLPKAAVHDVTAANVMPATETGWVLLRSQAPAGR